MQKYSFVSVALGGALFISQTCPAQFASRVVSYSPGIGASASYQDASRALGAPTTFIGYQNTDPFNPAYATTDLVSVGVGGSLTLGFSQPILNTAHAFGLDFSIFGNAGFIITNGDYAGGGITDGSLFAQNTGVTRVSVSMDNVTYFELNPLLAPTVDTYFPTDASGNYQTPMNPALTGSSFAGLDLAGIRALYAGSGGGAGYDISWAQDGWGNNVSLASVSFVRIDVLSGKSDIDALVAVPEPTTLSLALLGLAGTGWMRGNRA